MNTEVEVALISAGAVWALTTVSAAVGWLLRGREAKSAAKAAQLAEIDAAVDTLLNEIESIDFASRDLATQRWWGIRFGEGLGVIADLVDAYRQDRLAAGMTRAVGRMLEFDRRGTAADREFTNGPLSAVRAAHRRLMMTARDFPELADAASNAATAAAELAAVQVRTLRTAAEQQQAQKALDEALSAFMAAWRRLNEPKGHRFARGRRRGRSSLPTSE